MDTLKGALNQNVTIITVDGRVLVGKLRGYDTPNNVILEKCHERIFSEEGVVVEPLGLYLVRGDNICIIGDMDEEKDNALDLEKIHAEPLQPVRY